MVDGLARARGGAVGAAIAAAVVLGSIVLGCSAEAAHPAGTVRTPSVSGPVNGGKGVRAPGTDYDLAPLGYVRDEYFVSGSAVAYEPTGALGADGQWSVKEGSSAPFETRLVVVRPSNPAKFNGTVFVEWLNVTGGFDVPVTWTMAHNQILREGAAFVGVSAQAIGVTNLVDADPARYGRLRSPGDAYAYDVFTQAGVAIRGKATGGSPLRGYGVKHVVAMGESQSADYLTTYVNAVHPLVRVYDGFLIHSRGSAHATLGTTGSPDGDAPNPRIRTDLHTPVLTFQTEYDVQALGFAGADQPDSHDFRLWEVAGTSHVDAYAGGPSTTDLGDGAAERTLLDPKNASGGVLHCDKPVNAGGQHAVLEAALAHLEAWVAHGTRPPSFPRIQTRNDGFVQVVRDAHGIARGGVRTPIVDVPVAVNAGDFANTPGTCTYFGTTTPFDAATLAALYPGGRATYLARFDAAADRAVEQGVWLEPEAKHYKAAARQIRFG
jgi:hypothetical protein